MTFKYNKINLVPLDPIRTINSGQVFLWEKYNNSWYGIDGNYILKLAINEKKLINDLENSWLILGEALQTVMRKYNIPSSYEKLKELTRGKQVDQEKLLSFIDGLELPVVVKDQLKSLRPQLYIGYAEKF